MSILSSSVSVTRYIVKGKLEKPVLEKIYNGLTQNSIKDIDDDHPEKIVGWTSFENPYVPDFEGSSFVIGSYMVFSMRLDRK
ncbi:MAG: exonuclease, partial [Proteobacteria bacterium]|nr:exonuclease [Pseudomonadota bacterium]